MTSSLIIPSQVPMPLKTLPPTSAILLPPADGSVPVLHAGSLPPTSGSVMLPTTSLSLRAQEVPVSSLRPVSPRKQYYFADDRAYYENDVIYYEKEVLPPLTRPDPVKYPAYNAGYEVGKGLVEPVYNGFSIVGEMFCSGVAETANYTVVPVVHGLGAAIGLLGLGACKAVGFVGGTLHGAAHGVIRPGHDVGRYVPPPTAVYDDYVRPSSSARWYYERPAGVRSVSSLPVWDGGFEPEPERIPMTASWSPTTLSARGYPRSMPEMRYPMSYSGGSWVQTDYRNYNDYLRYRDPAMVSI
eukprot:TRINITY_DN45153_c0_g1_i1.p1 TRINITY_DN45153_c0_g1~~TRINITY_DN45153_c0_g1_i1.p1  ORF type:complete len:299 (+),score=34.29 TRINITY_DN45153_c0_g1_i1:58-954(+)